MADTLPGRQCRFTGVHPEHDYAKAGVYYHCPGLPCDHYYRCCDEHGVHASPHVGCLLR